MPKQKPLVERIPDQLIIRLFKEGRLQDLKELQEDPRTRRLTLTFKDGAVHHMMYLGDLGWIPEIPGAGSDPCAKA